jgi:hypothetical protein
VSHTLLQSLGNILDESLINKLMATTAAKALLTISSDQLTIFILHSTTIDSDRQFPTYHCYQMIHTDFLLDGELFAEEIL